MDDDTDLTVLLAAIVKKNGGELRLSEDEVAIVTRQDLITMYFDLKTNEIILRTLNMPVSYDATQEN
jgi:hypothetical protein